MAKVSPHAAKRLMRRKGLKKANIAEDFEEAMEKGIKHADMKGAMKKEIGYKMYLHGSNAVYYQNLLYFYDDRTGNLKTVVPLPNRFRKYIK